MVLSVDNSNGSSGWHKRIGFKNYHKMSMSTVVILFAHDFLYIYLLGRKTEAFIQEYANYVAIWSVEFLQPQYVI